MITKINKILGGSLMCCAVGTALMSLSSCSDFLEIKPQSEIILEDFWNEKADVDNIVAGCYSALLEDGVRRRMMIWGEARSDNFMSGENINSDADLYKVIQENITAMNSYTTWDGFYDVINRCNTVLKYAPGVAAIDPAYTTGDLKATIAEVTALRALCYFYLIRTFRDVPYSDEAFTDDDQTMDLPATPFYTVLGYLIADLERVKDDAVVRYPETKPRYQTGRITRDAIYAMLCEMYLWNKDYDNCIKYAELVIQSKKAYEEEERNKGGRGLANSNQSIIEARLNGYPLANDNISGTRFGSAYEAIFVDGASKETIFELSYEDNPSNVSMTNNSAISSLYGNSTSRLGLLAATEVITEDIKTASSRKVYEDDNKFLDARLYYNCRQEDGAILKYATSSVTVDGSRAGTGTWNSQAADYSWFPQNSNGSKWIIYRLADIMLLEAEALCQKMGEGGDADVIDSNTPLLDKAFTLVNAINKRSLCKALLTGTDTLKRADYSTKSLMETLVKKERRNELMFEGKYWYDLVRYCLRANSTQEIIDAAQNRSKDVNASFVQSFFKRMDAIFWPYNNEEMKVNTNLVPNPAFGSGESTSYEKTK